MSGLRIIDGLDFMVVYKIALFKLIIQYIICTEFIVVDCFTCKGCFILVH